MYCSAAYHILELRDSSISKQLGDHLVESWSVPTQTTTGAIQARLVEVVLHEMTETGASTMTARDHDHLAVHAPRIHIMPYEGNL